MLPMPENERREFRPELLPRRGELNAWILATVAVVGLLILNQTLEIVPGWTWFFCGFLVFSALSISFGNWMDRQTRIALEADGIRYESGIRRVWLGWQEVQKVAILPSRWGSSVQVVGEKSHFGFNTLGEVQFQGEVRGRTGFAEGQTILDAILRETGLVLIEESNSAYYYTRG